mmetsp:Transcript_15567/g.43683  ORF Transcript_15567/g.43683 Transcript_15567/m.43683 type:complete len:245 (-) Transcript_15567:898-1632(-)
MRRPASARSGRGAFRCSRRDCLGIGSDVDALLAFVADSVVFSATGVVSIAVAVVAVMNELAAAAVVIVIRGSVRPHVHEARRSGCVRRLPLVHRWSAWLRFLDLTFRPRVPGLQQCAGRHQFPSCSISVQWHVIIIVVTMIVIVADNIVIIITVGFASDALAVVAFIIVIPKVQSFLQLRREDALDGFLNCGVFGQVGQPAPLLLLLLLILELGIAFRVIIWFHLQCIPVRAHVLKIRMLQDGR